MAVKRKVEDDSIRSLPSRSPGTAKKNRVNVDMEGVGEKSDTGAEAVKGGASPHEEVEALKPGLGPISTSDDEESDLAEGEEERLQYEEERNRILEENRKRMQELGLSNLSQHLSPAYRTKVNMKSGLQAVKKNKQMKEAALQAGFQPRRSARREGRKAPDYWDIVKVKEEPQEVKPRHPRREVKSASDRKPAEAYTEEHIQALGTYNTEWTLFQDGYSADGVRIYDPVLGKTCHQCRQKTMGRRTWCNSCKMLAGQFCGDCLFMRYGENVLEANANPNWACPGCRGICNCSICRMRKGWPPTGNMYRYALSEGYRSVAHYLVMTRQRKHELVKAGDKQLECEKVEEKVMLLLECVKAEGEENGQPDCGEGEHKANGQLECKKLEPEGNGSLECLKLQPEDNARLDSVLVEPGDAEIVFQKGADHHHRVQCLEENQRTRSEEKANGQLLECRKLEPKVNNCRESVKVEPEDNARLDSVLVEEAGDSEIVIEKVIMNHHVQCVEENQMTKSEPEAEKKDHQLSPCLMKCEKGGDVRTAEVKKSLGTSDQTQNAKHDEEAPGRSKVSGRAAVRKLSTSLSCGAETVSARLRRKEVISYKRFL